MLTKTAGLQVSCARYTDAILFSETAALNPPYILKLLYSIPSRNGLRVIIIRLSNNLINVYAIPKQVVERSAYE